MQFAHKILLALLALIPLLLVLYRWRERRRGTLVFSDISPFRDIPATGAVRHRHILIALRVVAVAALVVAFARPQSTSKTEQVYTEGIDIVLALDASGSMEAEDFRPKNRFEAARDVISDFIEQTSNNRLGLVIYASNAYTQCPLTLDYSVLLNILDRTHLGMIDNQSTAIGMAIATSVNRLKKSEAKSKVVILLTDGRNNKGEIDPVTAARIASTFGIKIYTIGMGREGGAPMYVDHPLMGRVVARDPRTGEIRMHEEPDEDTLVEIARITGGRYFRATDEKKLMRIYDDIAAMEKSKIKTEQKINYTEYFQYPLLAAIALLALELALGATRFRTLP